MIYEPILTFVAVSTKRLSLPFAYITQLTHTTIWTNRWCICHSVRSDHRSKPTTTEMCETFDFRFQLKFALSGRIECDKMLFSNQFTLISSNSSSSLLLIVSHFRWNILHFQDKCDRNGTIERISNPSKDRNFDFWFWFTRKSGVGHPVHISVKNVPIKWTPIASSIIQFTIILPADLSIFYAPNVPALIEL